MMILFMDAFKKLLKTVDLKNERIITFFLRNTKLLLLKNCEI